MNSIEKLYNLFIEYPEIVTDSRKARSGSLFFALNGEKFDGNIFARQALESGCNFAICDNKKVIEDERFIYVNNVLKALQELASFHRMNLNIPIIAITGTNGKTTTKELLKLILEKKYKTFATIGNYNNHIGVPLSLLRIEKDTDIGIIEMGANHVGEISTLCKISSPNYGLITNIGKAHLEGFGSEAGILKAKTELYKYLNINNGKVFINSDSDLLISELSSFKGEIIKYGTKGDVFCKGNIIKSNEFINGLIEFNKTKQIEINSRLFGDYNFENILAAATVGKYFNVNMEDIKSAIDGYNPDNNRSQLIETNKNKVILDAYNANPSSMSKAIHFFNQLKDENKMVILGDMLELGEYSIDEHKRIINELENYKINNVLFVGNNFSNATNHFQTFLNTDDLIEWIKKNEVLGYTILVKGSRKMRLEKLVSYL